MVDQIDGLGERVIDREAAAEDQRSEKRSDATGGVQVSARDLSGEKQILKEMSKAMYAERARLEKLVGGQQKNFRLNGWGRIGERFNPPMKKLEGCLYELSVELEKADPSPEDLDRAWELLGEARGQHLPPLANDLLAAIGGLYLRENCLDDAGTLLAARKDTDPISFSGLAESLVENDLKKRTGGSQGTPVLIVGEERLDVSGALIRLRFPACDIWSLPLAAHEYGHLLARWDDPNLSGFAQLRKELDAETKSGKKPPDRLQDRRLCRIFADAFATLFGGPAYLFSLLYLRFCPSELLPSEMPSFTERFLSALNILRLMDEQPLVEPTESFRNRFGLVRKLLEYQRSVVWKVANLDPEDAALSEQCVSWSQKIYNCFNVRDFKVSIKETYDIWKNVTEPGNGITSVLAKGTESPIGQRPPVWEVLNAAWFLRTSPPKDFTGTLEDISCNALSLLDKDDNSLIRSEARPSPPAMQRPRPSPRPPIART